MNASTDPLYARLQVIDADNRRLREDLNDAMYIIERQRDLLNGVAFGLYGPREDNYLFEGLPELAKAAMDRAIALEKRVDQLETELRRKNG